MKKNLKDIFNEKYRFSTGPNSLVHDFYIPVLACAKSYDRSVAYFTSSLLVSACDGLSALIKTNGRMRLVIGSPLDDDEYQAIKDSKDIHQVTTNIKEKLISILNGDEGEIFQYKLDLLTYMMANGTLDIKYAIQPKGIYHKKIGIVHDYDGYKVAFSGSANETYSAMDPERNSEEVTVYHGWDDRVYESYGKELEDEFYNLWEKGKHYQTYTFDMPSDFYDDIIKARKNMPCPDLDKERLFDGGSIIKEIKKSRKNKPTIPELWDGKKFKIKDHQKNALNAWSENDYHGILELATGSGKTITAIYGAVKLYEENKRLTIVISAPTIPIAEQWVEVLEKFSIIPIKCFHTKNSWITNLQVAINAYNLKRLDFLAVVVVNASMIKAEFKTQINRITENLMFIGDECHSHGSEGNFHALPVNAKLRLGLSATPYVDFDAEFDSPFINQSKDRLHQYYNSVVFIYSLGEAIKDKVLTGYEYKVCDVRLTEEEQDNYEKITKKIAKALTIQDPHERKVQFDISCAERGRLLGAAENKIVKLASVLSKIPLDHRGHSLFYCATGKNSSGDDNIKLVTRLLDKRGWSSSRFTHETKARQKPQLIKSFTNGNIDALVSMKVLDEGVDIPVCRTAFILASTKNSRQYIQRRGRILRKSQGKTIAKIYDFVVLPSKDRENISASKQLIESELKRIKDFASLAINENNVHNYLNSLEIKL
jgi:superfamily II DNA or RNA helicase